MYRCYKHVCMNCSNYKIFITLLLQNTVKCIKDFLNSKHKMANAVQECNATTVGTMFFYFFMAIHHGITVLSYTFVRTLKSIASQTRTSFNGCPHCNKIFPFDSQFLNTPGSTCFNLQDCNASLYYC